MQTVSFLWWTCCKAPLSPIITTEVRMIKKYKHVNWQMLRKMSLPLIPYQKPPFDIFSDSLVNTVAHYFYNLGPWERETECVSDKMLPYSCKHRCMLAKFMTMQTWLSQLDQSFHLSRSSLFSQRIAQLAIVVGDYAAPLLVFLAAFFVAVLLLRIS